MEIEALQLEIDSYTKNANVVKELVIQRMLLDGVLTPEKAEEYGSKWQVIVFKKNWFKHWVDVFSKKEPSGWGYKFVKFEE